MKIPFMNFWESMDIEGRKPLYQLPIYYCSHNGKFIMYWGLGWFYFKQLFKRIPDGTLHRTVWFSHLKTNFIRIPLMPLLMLSNFLNSGKTRFIKKEF